MEKRDIVSLADSYREAKILLTANEYDLFTYLSGKPASAKELAEIMDADVRGLELLLNALVAMGFLEKEGDIYSNSEASERFLVKGKPDYIGDWVKHANHGYSTWGGLERRIFRRKPRRRWRESFLRALDNTAVARAEELASEVEIKGKKLLDLGGGSGAYSWVLSRRLGMEATIVETSDMAPVTRKLLREKGAEDIRIIEGDFLVDPLGRGYDVVLVSNIIHFQSIEENKRLIARAYNVLEEGGMIVVHDYILNDDKTSPRDAAIFAIHMLLNSEEGRTYSWSEVEAWLGEVGFAEMRRYQLQETRVVTGVKP
jgi:ubiquinone/menaquinone biosynthesis C-methylase UbiE